MEWIYFGGAFDVLFRGVVGRQLRSFWRPPPPPKWWAPVSSLWSFCVSADGGRCRRRRRLTPSFFDPRWRGVCFGGHSLSLSRRTDVVNSWNAVYTDLRRSTKAFSYEKLLLLTMDECGTAGGGARRQRTKMDEAKTDPEKSYVFLPIANQHNLLHSSSFTNDNRSGTFSISHSLLFIRLASCGCGKLKKSRSCIKSGVGSKHFMRDGGGGEEEGRAEEVTIILVL